MRFCVPLSIFHPSYILWFYYTTDGETVALIVGVLRAQERRVEVQVPSVGTRADLRLPVAAVATHIVEITAIPIEEPSAEEGLIFIMFMVKLFCSSLIIRFSPS